MGKLDFGRVLESSFRLLLRRADIFFPLAAVPFALMIPVQFMALRTSKQFEESAASQRAPQMEDVLQLLGTTLGAAFVSMVITSIVSAAAIHGVVMLLRQRPVTLGDCVRTGARRLGAVLLVSIGVGIGTFAGATLCIIPGLMIACAWYVAVVATVAEGTPVGAAFSRSAALTRGNRWVVLLILIVVAVGSGMLGGVIGAIGALFLPLVAQAILVTVVSAAVAALGAVIQGVTYYELRVLKEGLAADDLAVVFA